MDLIKQYIVQSISAASNNLRLSTQKIEVVALLREMIVKSDDLERDIKKMKKITEFSTLAIRLNEIYTYLTQNPVDFFKVSEKFKVHSQYLIKDLSHMLEIVNPQTFKKAFEKINELPPGTPIVSYDSGVNNSTKNEPISVDLSKRKTESAAFEKSESDELKEKFILDEDKEEEDLFFQNYETAILKPIKSIDTMLKHIADNEIDSEEIFTFSEIMEKNGELSEKVGFEIISNMHKIMAKALKLIHARELMPGKDIIESMRACLIVIVAVVRGKEVDITNYLNKAEEFGRKIQSIKIKDFN
jgi:hypothetical protein